VQSVGAGKGGGKRRRIVEVGLADVDALRREIGELFRMTCRRDHRSGLGLDQKLDDAPAEMAAGAGDEQGRFRISGHWQSPLRCCLQGASGGACIGYE
jgi:hypothetical protein